MQLCFLALGFVADIVAGDARQAEAREKTTHSEGHVHLTKVGDLSSPGSVESCG